MRTLYKYLKECFSDWRCIYYYTQKGTRNPWIRRVLGKVMAKFRPKSDSPASDTRSTRLVEELHQQGFSYVTDLIRPGQITEILNHLAVQDCTDVYHPELGKFKAPAGVPDTCRKLRYDARTLVDCPHLLDIANHPVVLAAVEKMFGCKPTISIVDAWWSMGGRPKDDQGNTYRDDMFHRDVEDLTFVKLFLYLTDVDEDSGPHAFVPGTHRSSKLVKRKALTDAEVTEAFGKDAVFTFLAPRGTAFMENTWGIHRATPVNLKHRLIYSVTYTLTGWSPLSPKEACASMGARSLDPYINRLYCRSDQPVQRREEIAARHN